MCETQTCKHLKVVIYISLCTNEGITRSRAHVGMVSVGQPKHETILEKKKSYSYYGKQKIQGMVREIT